MQLKTNLCNDEDSRNTLRHVILEFYKRKKDRTIDIFFDKTDKEGNRFEVYFLIDRKHVASYGILEERYGFVGGITLAIGPHYFSPSQFWSYENARRFQMEASIGAVEHNLKLLDEFLGHPSIGYGLPVPPP